MDLISLEIHIYLEIKGEHTLNKTYLWFGVSWNTHRVSRATVQQAMWLGSPQSLQKFGLQKKLLFNCLRSMAFLCQGCDTETLQKGLEYFACLNHKDPIVLGSGEAPTFHPEGSTSNAVARTLLKNSPCVKSLVSPNWDKQNSWSSSAFWEIFTLPLCLWS